MFRLVPGVQLLSLCCTDCGRHRLCHVRCHAAHPHSTVQRDTCLSSVGAECPHSRPASIKHWDHQSRSIGRGIYLEVKPDLLCDRLEPSLHPSTRSTSYTMLKSHLIACNCVVQSKRETTTQDLRATPTFNLGKRDGRSANQVMYSRQLVRKSKHTNRPLACRPGTQYCRLASTSQKGHYPPGT